MPIGLNSIEKVTSTDMGTANSSSQSIEPANLVSSPIAFGAKDHYYSFNLDALKQERLYWGNFSDRTESTANSYRAAVNQAQNPFADFWGRGLPRWSDQFIETWRDISGKEDNSYIGRDWELYYNSQNTPYGRAARDIEDRISTKTLAGAAAGYSTMRDRANGLWWSKVNRPTSASLSKDLAAYALPKIDQQGPFVELLANSDHGFLTSIANDFDVQWHTEIDVHDYNYESNSTRKLSTYWPDRLGTNHPLRDIYNLFYSKTSKSHWDNAKDFDGTALEAPTTSIYKDYLSDPTVKNIDLGKNKFTLLGPVSNSNIVAGDGKKVIAASPVMTPIIERTSRLSDEKGDINDEFRADTVLYPSPVGAYHTNTLDAGDGDSIIYYDSSFKKISTRKGNQIFLPSFGSFNWSIDWIPAAYDSAQRWLDPELWSSSGPPLISPIPWDKQIIDPKEGKDKPLSDKSYADTMSAFAADPKRGDLSNQSNYLYTIFSKESSRKESDAFTRTYLNLRPDVDGETPLISRNPVNRLGGTEIVAGRFSSDWESPSAQNYSIPSGDKTFFGMDWELWQHLLPQYGSTLANNPAGTNKQNRAAQHAWNTVTFAGGRGNNTFNLGNIVDNITNNGLFYLGDASYKISLTHDGYWSPQKILDEGMAFGNVFGSSDQKGSAYISTVNMNLQAEPNSYSVMAQTADPGEKGNDFYKNVLPWTGLAGYTQKLLKTPLDTNKDYVDNWATKHKVETVKTGPLTLKDTNQEFSFLSSLKTVEYKPSTKKWIDQPFAKGIKLALGQVFPWIDLASSTISTVKGLVEFFNSKAPAPPRQELSTTFKEQGLSTDKKAVLINDWNPYAKININLPALKPSSWDPIELTVEKPLSDGKSNRKNGAYLNLRFTKTINSVATQINHPLVVLDNLNKHPRINGIQKDGGQFDYYTYSFITPDPTDVDIKKGQFNPIRSSSLRLFGQLSNPKKLEEDGITSSAITFPSDYDLRSPNNFPMQYDAENYNAFSSEGSSEGSKHYSRYYLGMTKSSGDNLPSDWTVEKNLLPYTSNVSLEFDSRTNGWYWQPVLKTVNQVDGSLDVATMLNPQTQDFDYDASKLWINLPEGWTSFSFNEIETNVTAYRYSRLATTFYATSTDKNGNGIADGQEEINRRTDYDRQLLDLAKYTNDITDIDQRLLKDEHKLYSLSQIKSVELVKNFQVNGLPIETACLVAFESAKKDGTPLTRHLVLYKDNNELMPAIAVDKDQRQITPSSFEFNYLVDPVKPTQRPAFDPSRPEQSVLVRSFAGLYDPGTNTTQLFEYVPFPKDDPDGLNYDESREAARSLQLPAGLSTGTTPTTASLATIESSAENDVITGLFEGKAWLGADNLGSDEQIKDKEGLYLLGDHNLWQWTEGRNQGKPFWIDYHFQDDHLQKDGPIDNRYSNWAKNGSKWESYKQVLTVDGNTGQWSQAFTNLPLFSGINGYLAEYAPIQGLPSLM